MGLSATAVAAFFINHNLGKYRTFVVLIQNLVVYQLHLQMVSVVGAMPLCHATKHRKKETPHSCQQLENKLCNLVVIYIRLRRIFLATI